MVKNTNEHEQQWWMRASVRIIVKQFSGWVKEQEQSRKIIILYGDLV